MSRQLSAVARRVAITCPYRRTPDGEPEGEPTPELLRCARCGATVAVLPPAATAWCLPCGQRMRPIRPKGTPRRDVTLGLHRLRHRFGTDVVREHGIAVGQVALRHSNPQTTARYAKEREHQVAAFVRTLRRG